MPTFRVWLVRYGRSEYELLDANTSAEAVEAARKKWRNKVVSVKPVTGRKAS